MQEFPERLRMFKLNAEYIREANAQIKDEEGDGAEVRSLPGPALHKCSARSVGQALHSALITPASKPFFLAHVEPGLHESDQRHAAGSISDQNGRLCSDMYQVICSSWVSTSLQTRPLSAR